MSNIRPTNAAIAELRPPGAAAAEIELLGGIARRWRAELARVLMEIDAEALALDAAQLADLALAMTELAEDQQSDGGLWHALEVGNRALFGTPLPLVWRSGDPELAPFDPRRFRFYLYSVWRLFKPDLTVAPTHCGFVAVANRAAAFFAEAFAGDSSAPSVAAFLGTANTRGWEVKRKLIWLGTRSFLFRFFHAAYLVRNSPAEDNLIGATDDFLCQECTAWSGFGVLDLLAAALDLPEADRTVLRGWHERHAAFYRVDKLHAHGAEIETMTVVNLINDQPYRVRLEIPRGQCPFASGQMVFGSLVPWRGEWYWSGGQQGFPQVPADVSAVKRSMIEKSSRIVYRYRADLAERARQAVAEHHKAFVKFHGSNLVVFPDGLTAAAAAQRQLREQIEARMGAELPEFLAKQGLDRTGPKFSWPAKLIACRRGVALFYHEGEGLEIMADFDVLRAALSRPGAPLSDEQAEVLRAFVESAEISPAFVQRVLREHGSAGLATWYFLPTGSNTEVEYLLRRFKGAYYRRRYPNISLTGVE